MGLEVQVPRLDLDRLLSREPALAESLSEPLVVPGQEQGELAEPAQA